MKDKVKADVAPAPSGQHTPGPWYATGVHVQSKVLEQDNYVCKAEGDTPEQAESNARLIAAAPELLEALKAILSLVGNANTTTTELTLRQARAAIAKAEGRMQ